MGSVGFCVRRKEERGIYKLINIFVLHPPTQTLVIGGGVDFQCQFTHGLSCIFQGRGALDRDDEVNTFTSLINQSSLWIYYRSLLHLPFVTLALVVFLTVLCFGIVGCLF